MPSPEEQAYGAVERAYGQGDFARALELALALQPQLPPGRPDLLDQRLQLLIGHIHLYGLTQPREAEAAYQTVLATCPEANYRQLAEQSLQLCAQSQQAEQAEPEEPTPTDAEASSANTSPSDLPATPWLQQLQDPPQALSEIKEAWGSMVPAKASETAPSTEVGEAATPWAPSPETQGDVSDATTAPPTTPSVEPPVIGQAETPLEAPKDAQPNLAVPAHAERSEPEQNEAMARDLERGLLLVKLSGRVRLIEAEALGQSAEANTHDIQKEPPALGGSWQRFKSRWLQFSRPQPNDDGGSGR
jgi:hypothetical protein